MVKIYHIRFITLVIYDLLIIVINFTYLCLVIFCHFDTFLDGWVGGWVGSIKIKDHLSPVEIEIGAELGKKLYVLQFGGKVGSKTLKARDGN